MIWVCLPHHWPFLGETISDGWFPSQRICIPTLSRFIWTISLTNDLVAGYLTRPWNSNDVTVMYHVIFFSLARYVIVLHFFYSHHNCLKFSKSIGIWYKRSKYVGCCLSQRRRDNWYLNYISMLILGKHCTCVYSNIVCGARINIRVT